MNRPSIYVIGSLIAAVLVALVAFVGARSLLGAGQDSANSASNSAQNAAQNADQNAAQGADQSATAGVGANANVAKRPACPEGPVAGVELECLGAQAKGKAKDVQVINVWAWWCEPCRAELPYVRQVADEHPEWSVVGVHADKNAANGASFLEDLGVNLASYQDSDNSFAGTLGLPGVIPVTVVAYKGEVKKQYVKPFESAEELEKAVEEALR